MFPHLFSIDSNVIFYIFRERAPRTYYQESVLKFVVSGQVPAGGYWGPGRTSCSLRDWEPSTLTQQSGQAPHFPQNLCKEILAGPENTARFNQEPISQGKFRAMRQVQGHARKPSDKSGTLISATHGQANSKLRLNPTQAEPNTSSNEAQNQEKFQSPNLNGLLGPWARRDAWRSLRTMKVNC